MKISQTNTVSADILARLSKVEDLNILRYTHIIRCKTIFGSCEIHLWSHSTGIDIFIPKQFHEISENCYIPKIINHIAGIAYNRVTLENNKYILKFIVENVGVKTLSNWEKAIDRWNTTQAKL